MDFALSPEVEALCGRIRSYVDTRLIPLEADRANFDAHENIAMGLLQTLRAEVRAMGIWALNVPKAQGGMELSMAEIAPCYEEMNRSIFGPVVFLAAAPDDGNIRLLNMVGTPAQKEKWLQPIIDGKVQSGFIMTEPMDEDGRGCGSDPSLTYTEATRTNTGWKIHGRKWFITGAESSKHFIQTFISRKDISSMCFFWMIHNIHILLYSLI